MSVRRRRSSLVWLAALALLVVPETARSEVARSEAGIPLLPGLELLQNGATAEAIVRLQGRLDRDPSDAEGLAGMAVVHLALERGLAPPSSDRPRGFARSGDGLDLRSRAGLSRALPYALRLLRHAPDHRFLSESLTLFADLPPAAAGIADRQEALAAQGPWDAPLLLRCGIAARAAGRGTAADRAYAALAHLDSTGAVLVASPGDEGLALFSPRAATRPDDDVRSVWTSGSYLGFLGGESRPGERPSDTGGRTALGLLTGLLRSHPREPDVVRATSDLLRRLGRPRAAVALLARTLAGSGPEKRRDAIDLRRELAASFLAARGPFLFASASERAALERELRSLREGARSDGRSEPHGATEPVRLADLPYEEPERLHRRLLQVWIDDPAAEIDAGAVQALHRSRAISGPHAAAYRACLGSWLLDARESPTGALAFFGERVRETPTMPFALFGLVNARLAAADHVGARAVLSRLEALDDPAYRALGSAARAFLAILEDRREEAIAFLDRALSTPPGEPGSTEPSRLHACYETTALHRIRSELLRKRGDIPGAIAALRTAIEVDPFDPEGHDRLERLLSARELGGQAVEHRERQLETDPENRIAAARRAILRAAHGEPALARKSLERLGDEVADSPELVFHLSRLHDLAGDRTAARIGYSFFLSNDLETLVAEESLGRFSSRPRVTLLRAAAALRLGRHTEAFAALSAESRRFGPWDRITDLVVGLPDLHFYLTSPLLDLVDAHERYLEDAGRLFDPMPARIEAIRLAMQPASNADRAALAHAAVALRRGEDPEVALRECREVLRGNPGHWYTQCLRGNALLRMTDHSRDLAFALDVRHGASTSESDLVPRAIATAFGAVLAARVDEHTVEVELLRDLGRQAESPALPAPFRFLLRCALIRLDPDPPAPPPGDPRDARRAPPLPPDWGARAAHYVELDPEGAWIRLLFERFGLRF